jgi:aminoglycoside phosphotransferase (APT) family kinase protein
MSNARSHDLGQVRAGEELDWIPLEKYLRDELPGLPAGFSVLQFLGGAANLTYLLQFGEQRLVLRRPPFGRIAIGGHDMSREYRALSRLWTPYPKAPHALLFCADNGIIGTNFLIMEFRQGVVIRDRIPAEMSAHTDLGRRIGLAVADALAELHLVDPSKCGLDDLGKPEGFLARQIAGWRRRWDAVAPPGGVAAMDSATDMLARNLPRTQRTSILHNDMKLDNCQFDPRHPDEVHSVFDWDMATLGDPLVDMGVLLNYWPDPADVPGDRSAHPPGTEQLGLPTRSEITSRYASQSGLDMNDLRWYEAYGTWKTAIIGQQLYDRFRRAETADVRMAARADSVPERAERSVRLLLEGSRG